MDIYGNLGDDSKLVWRSIIHLESADWVRIALCTSTTSCWSSRSICRGRSSLLSIFWDDCDGIRNSTQTWLVVWNMTCIFPYIGNNHPNWRSYFSEGWLNHQAASYRLKQGRFQPLISWSSVPAAARFSAGQLPGTMGSAKAKTAASDAEMTNKETCCFP